MRLKPLMDWLVYVLIRVFICVIQSLPIETCHAPARRSGLRCLDVIRVRYRVVEDNLRHVFPDWTTRIGIGSFAACGSILFLMVAEVAQARRKIHETSFAKYVHSPTSRLLVRYLLDPRPCPGDRSLREL